MERPYFHSTAFRLFRNLVTKCVAAEGIRGNVPALCPKCGFALQKQFLGHCIIADDVRLEYLHTMFLLKSDTCLLVHICRQIDKTDCP